MADRSIHRGGKAPSFGFWLLAAFFVFIGLVPVFVSDDQGVQDINGILAAILFFLVVIRFGYWILYWVGYLFGGTVSAALEGAREGWREGRDGARTERLRQQVLTDSEAQ